MQASPHKVVGFKGTATAPCGNEYEATMIIMFPLTANINAQEVHGAIQRNVNEFSRKHGGVKGIQQFERVIMASTVH